MRETTTAEKLAFDDSVIIVTGGAQGIGRGVCEAFASLGANIAIADISEDNAQTTAAELEDAYGIEAIAVQTDVSDYQDAVDLADTVVDTFGHIDVLVNNAGIGDHEQFMDMDPEEWNKVVDVCYHGTLNCTHAVLSHMVERNSGSIVNFASDSYQGNDPGLAVYGGAKAANVAFTKTVAKEVGEHGVRVNCVSPGTTWTPATEDWLEEYGDQVVESYALDRMGKPEDIADAVVFLSSDAADWITGQVLSVNGGYFRG